LLQENKGIAQAKRQKKRVGRPLKAGENMHLLVTEKSLGTDSEIKTTNLQSEGKK